MAFIVSGNHLVQKGFGKPIRLAGLCLQDPLWQRLSPGPRMLPHGPVALEAARDWGANVVRIPFHPVTIRHAGNGDWIRGLEAVVSELEWILLAAHALELAVIVDFHAIGFPALGSTFEFDEAPYKDIYRTDQDEIEAFWEVVSARFGTHSSVAAFEIFNEATRESAFGNAADWSAHAEWAERLIKSVIRPNATDMICVVGGLHYGYDLEFVLQRPIEDAQIAYSSHPYPHHSQAKTWDRAFGKVAERYPVLLTEVGFATSGFFGREHHRGFRDWELEIKSFADARELSFCAWNFSMSWEPTLLRESGAKPGSPQMEFGARFEPNEAGLFFQEWLEECAAIRRDELARAAEEARAIDTTLLS